ncbi:hypothetical protein NEIELOOT_02216 [Neisseria elongata subsp. glycolytica ATCC 29315]|uniref:Uncharacterized protein n=1 Tax=Neisseria elongata subsp. glycolytica ATCC 29315 TaxID=546263 RepID=D4DT18_NEIEG|nr:hypothetical protein NEIELOOT_02216 [Neisseria elongata subsp. glycolytica ATCC 29315]
MRFLNLPCGKVKFFRKLFTKCAAGRGILTSAGFVFRRPIHVFGWGA